MATPKQDNANGDSEFEYDLFLSYSTNPDYRLARDLERFLESFHLLPTQGEFALKSLNVCRDGSDFYLPPVRERSGNDDDRTREVIEGALVKCRHLLVICSYNAPSSRYVNFELSWFLDHRPENILLAVSEGEDPGAEPASVFPPRVLQSGLYKGIWYDFRGHNWRKAAGWQKVRDFDDERVRLAAHLNGTTLGKLRPLYLAERERAQRTKKRIITGALIFLCSIIVVGVFLVWDRARERARAEQQRMLALGRATAVQALKSSEQSDDETAALLARQSFLFQERSRTQLLNEADNALRRVMGKRHFSRSLLSTRMASDVADFTPDLSRAVFYLYSGLHVLELNRPGAQPMLLPSSETLRVSTVALSGDGQLVAAADSSKLLIWDLTQNQVVHLPQNALVKDVVFTGSGQVVFSLAGGGLRMLRGPNWVDQPVILRRKGSEVVSLAADEGRRLAAATKDATVLLWDTQAPTLPATVLRDAGFIRALAFDPSRDRLFASTNIPGPHYWDLYERNPRAHQVKHTSAGSDVIAISRDGRPLLASIVSATVWFWPHLEEQPMKFDVPAPIVAARFHPDGASVGAVSTRGDIRLWQLNELGAVTTIDTEVWSLGTPTVGKSGALIAAAAHSEVVVWDAQRQKLHYLSPPDVWESVAALNPDGSWLAVSGQLSEEPQAGQATPVFLWRSDALNDQPAVSLGAGIGDTQAITFCRAGRWLGAAGDDGRIRLWRTNDFASPPLVFEGHQGAVLSITITQDGKTLLSGGADGTIRVWDVATPAKTPLVVETGAPNVLSLSLTTDESVLAAALGDVGIRLWDMRRSPPTLINDGPAQFDSSRVVAFSNDEESQWLASGKGAEAYLWDWRNPLSTPLILPEHDSGNVNVTGVVFTDHGSKLIVTAGTSSIRVWLTETRDLADLVCTKVSRNLSQQEWRSYIGPNIPYETTCPNRAVPSSMH